MNAASGRWSHLPSHNLLEAADRVGERRDLPGLPVNASATKNGCDRNRSIRRARCTISLSSSRQLVDAEDRDDVLQFAVALEDLLHAAGDVVVLLADVLRVEDAAVRRQRVDGRVDALLGDRPFEVDERVEVPKVVAGAGSVGSSAGTYTACTEVMAPFVRRGDPLLQARPSRWPASAGNRRRRASGRERRHFRAGLAEAEDVVDEQQRVGAGRVAEPLGHRQGREGDAEAGAGRLVHLAEAPSPCCR